MKSHQIKLKQLTSIRHDLHAVANWFCATSWIVIENQLSGIVECFWILIEQKNWNLVDFHLSKPWIFGNFAAFDCKLSQHFIQISTISRQTMDYFEQADIDKCALSIFQLSTLVVVLSL